MLESKYFSFFVVLPSQLKTALLLISLCQLRKGNCKREVRSFTFHWSLTKWVNQIPVSPFVSPYTYFSTFSLPLISKKRNSLLGSLCTLCVMYKILYFFGSIFMPFPSVLQIWHVFLRDKLCFCRGWAQALLHEVFQEL